MGKFNNNCVVLSLLVLLVILLQIIEARRHAPLFDNDLHLGKNRNAECTFGKQIKEIGSSWFADLGPPFGVMYCIKCECVKVQKKRRLVARVQCRNIKNECPKPSCDEPVLLPGRCCKTCPGDFYSPDIPLDGTGVGYSNDEEEKSMKHYAALLTGRSSLVVKREDALTVPVSVNKNNVVATGRFTFHRKNLYYSFYVSDKAARPRHLQFIDHTGNILEEHELSGPGIVPSLYQNVTRKICGVWKRLPRDYRRLLKDQKLYAVLVWGMKEQLEFVLSGPIMRFVALGTELFSALLEPAQGTDANLMAGAGATAIVSTSSASTPSIHIEVVFNGIFSPDETADVPINITLSLEEKHQIIIEEIKRVKKPAHELNIIEVSSPVSATDLRLLTRGRLVLSISSVHRPEALRLTGAVVTRATCELFQTPLSAPSAELDTKLESPSGLAWLFMNSEGALVFNIQIEENGHNVALISLVDMSSKRKTEIDDLTPFYGNNGWANGTIERLGPKYLEPLYSGNVVLNVTFQNKNTQTSIRGRLTSRPVAEARDSRDAILLKRSSRVIPKNAVAMAWLSVDQSCYLHYDVSLSGMSSFDKNMQLYMIDKPMEAPGAPVTTKLLEEFKGNQVEDSGNVQLTREQISHLESGVVYLEIHEKDTLNILLKGTIKQIKVPVSCLPSYNDNDVPTSHLDRPSSVTEPARSCYSEGRFYEEGSDWRTSFDPCTMCFCQNGKVKCETTTCPFQTCKLGTRSTGECCPPCLNSTTQQDSNTSVSQGCKLGKLHHSPGSRWHPFLVPSGFDRCTECRCDPNTLEVKCSRMTCILDCDERVAVRVDEKSCCKQCPNTGNDSVQNYEPYKLILTEPLVYEMPPGSCKIYGGIVKNGTVFHPRIASIGEHKCTICTCKDGSPFCERLKCTKSMCNNTTYRERRNISESTLEKCCSCKRLRRHHNHRSHSQS